MKIGKACILCEGMNVNNSYTREAVAMLEGTKLGCDGRIITTEEVGGKLCAFIEVPLPNIIFTCKARSVVDKSTVTYILSADVGSVGSAVISIAESKETLK